MRFGVGGAHHEDIPFQIDHHLMASHHVQPQQNLHVPLAQYGEGSGEEGAANLHLAGVNFAGQPLRPHPDGHALHALVNQVGNVAELRVLAGDYADLSCEEKRNSFMKMVL